MPIHRLFFVFLPVLLAACARLASPPQLPATALPAPIRPLPESLPPATSSPAPAQPEAESATRGEPGPETPAPTTSSAVLALLSEAGADLDSGNLDNAAGTLERAIRIQPYHPLLWQQLAEVRLKQGQPGLAGELARKSNRYANGDEALMRRNLAIIAEARRRTGNTGGAAPAEQ